MTRVSKVNVWELNLVLDTYSIPLYMRILKDDVFHVHVHVPMYDV